MSRTTALSALCLAAFLGSAAACAGNPAPERVYVADQPPTPRYEVIPARPGRAYVWAPGFWARDRAGFNWVAGHYASPPARMRRWEPARWRHDSRGWFFVEGHWR